jgi:hypothetical protein
LSADADLSGVCAKASWDEIIHCDNNSVQSRKVLTLVIGLPLDLLHEVASASLSDAFLSDSRKRGVSASFHRLRWQSCRGLGILFSVLFSVHQQISGGHNKNCQEDG